VASFSVDDSTADFVGEGEASADGENIADEVEVAMVEIEALDVPDATSSVDVVSTLVFPETTVLDGWLFEQKEEQLLVDLLISMHQELENDLHTLANNGNAVAATYLNDPNIRELSSAIASLRKERILQKKALIKLIKAESRGTALELTEIQKLAKILNSRIVKKPKKGNLRPDVINRYKKRIINRTKSKVAKKIRNRKKTRVSKKDGRKSLNKKRNVQLYEKKQKNKDKQTKVNNYKQRLRKEIKRLKKR
jgi:hypothetical protein